MAGWRSIGAQWRKSPSLSREGWEASDRPLHQHLLGLGDRLGRVEALGADVRAVHDRVAAIEAERILQLVEPLAGQLVAAVGQPAIGLEQDGRAEETVGIPPVARAGRRAAGAQDA